MSVYADVEGTSGDVRAHDDDGVQEKEACMDDSKRSAE